MNTCYDTKSISEEEFYHLLRKEGSLRNTAATCSDYDPEHDRITWFLAGVPVAYSDGQLGSRKGYHWITGEIDCDSRTITEYEQ